MLWARTVPYSPQVANSTENVLLEIGDSFTYLGPAIISKLCFVAEINRCIEKAAAVLFKLRKQKCGPTVGQGQHTAGVPSQYP